MKAIIKSPEVVRKENKIKELRKKIKKRQSVLKGLKTRLSNMKSEVERIQREVQSKVFDSLGRLHDLIKEVGELAKKMEKIKGISKADKASLKEMADTFAGSVDFGEDFEDYKEQREKMEEGNFDYDEYERARIKNIFEQYQVKPEEKEQRSIRKVYLKLSQKFHPDLAKNEKEAERFHTIMLQINEAYQSNDIQTLLDLERRYLVEELDLEGTAVSMDMLDMEIQRLEKKLNFIENQVNRTSGEIKNLRQSDFGTMLTAVGQAERAGHSMSDMTAQYDQLTEILTKIRDGFQDSIKRKSISPLLMEFLVGNPFSNFFNMGMDEDDFFGEDFDEDDILEMLGGMFGFDDDDDDDEYGAVANPKFPINSSVKVKMSLYPDTSQKINLKNWQGRVEDVYIEDYTKVVYVVSFDSITMKAMPKEYILKILEDDEDFQNQVFYENQLTATRPRDTQEEAFSTYRKLFHRYKWLYLDKPQRKRIERIMLQSSEHSDDENWSIYLSQNLTFPFSASSRGVIEGNYLPKVKVLGIVSYDEDYGHLAKIKIKGKRYTDTFPIMDLEPSIKNNKNWEVLDDYFEWSQEMLV